MLFLSHVFDKKKSRIKCIGSYFSFFAFIKNKTLKYFSQSNHQYTVKSKSMKGILLMILSRYFSIYILGNPSAVTSVLL